MTVAELLVASVILPRIESPKAISRLTQFEWFHKLDMENETITPEIDDLLLRAQKVHQFIEEIIKELKIPLRVGIMEILFKGTVFKKKNYEINEIENMISDLEKTPDIITKIAKLLKENSDINYSLEEYRTLKDTLQIANKLNIDLSNFGLMNHFYANLFVINSADYGEIERILEGIPIFKYDLESKEKLAVIIISDASDSDRILKVMRSINSNPFSIPKGFPQIPSESYSLAELKIKELSDKQKLISKEISDISHKIRGEILALHENAFVLKEVLETLRKPGGTKNFAVIQGFIPKKMEKKFKQITNQWTSITEEIEYNESSKDIPVYLDNPRWVKTFEVITDSQGLPKRKEFDPTWMISLMWPIFYGLMFADLGHGLLLMGLGLLFKFKGQGNLSRWGMLLAISGGAGAIAGIFQGEAFGFHLESFAIFHSLLQEGGPLHSLDWLIGIITVSELTFVQVIMILKVSIFLGVIHLGWAFILRIHNYWRIGDKDTMIFEAIPNLFMWLGVFAVMMGAIGSGYDVMNMYSKIHTEAVPWISVIVGDWAVVWLVVRVAVIVIIASMVMMIIGGIKHNKKHPEAGGDMVSVIMEVFLGKSIECLAHTISYARIGIMLLVHAALLLTVNKAYESMGGLDSPTSLVLIVGGQIGIMMIEGLIVYIQSLRLHLYEFFTKWYYGGSQPFKQLVPEMVYNLYSWKNKQ
ncbi:MAG TPA: V-type ATPase 116kDa subunit family protein [Nitrosarchaeum sp.]|nr:V-type ATPase 116kDa subunit family protein [Nitrosarchaeum sp.]